jgi:hypothetical protein
MLPTKKTVCSALNSSASVFAQQKVRFHGGTLNKRWRNTEQELNESPSCLVLK